MFKGEFMNIIKYLKDENGEIFSPIVNVNSIYGENGEKLSSFIYQRKLLWESMIVLN